MPVNGRSFAILCDDGQEPRIRRLAQYVDGKVAEFVGSVGQVGEARLLGNRAKSSCLAALASD